MNDDVPVSVVVMTKNEERNIRKCLGALAAFSEVFVVDSGSQDATADIARQLGATVVDFSWDGGYPKKKEWCRRSLDFAHEWVLYVDADEEVTTALAEEIADAIRATEADGYFIRSEAVFLHRRLRWGLKTQKLALFRHGRGRFLDIQDEDVDEMWEVEGHYQPVIDGRVRALRSPLVHHDVKDLYSYFERHNRYSDWEAVLRDRGGIRHPDESNLPVRGRLKRLFDALPGKPLLVFVYAYVLRAGFLDGMAGLHYATFRAFYYWQVGLKRIERRLDRRGPRNAAGD